MSFHIEADRSDIAGTVLISGDPLRIKHMSETLLDDARCVNEIRGMLGYTGFYKGRQVSMLGTGMGMPTTAIFLHELFNNYDVDVIIRVGTMGAMRPELEIGHIVLPISAHTDSNINRQYFNGLDFSPSPDYSLLSRAHDILVDHDLPVTVGSIFSTDLFYNGGNERWDKWIEHGNLGVEMETSIVYTMALKYGKRALSILSVSDNIVTGTSSLPEFREKSFTEMFEVALELVE